MKKIAIIVSLLLLGTPLSGAHAAQAVKSGATCKTVGSKTTVAPTTWSNKSVVYTCALVKGKKIYGPGVAVYKISSLLTVSQQWEGNKVTLTLIDSKGNNCDLQVNQVAGSECFHFYMGWRTNFNDAERTVEYLEGKTVISGMKIGDSGVFELKYQDESDPKFKTPLIVKEFSFSYGY